MVTGSYTSSDNGCNEESNVHIALALIPLGGELIVLGVGD